jgi:hypothetical protein
MQAQNKYSKKFLMHIQLLLINKKNSIMINMVHNNKDKHNKINIEDNIIIKIIIMINNLINLNKYLEHSLVEREV